MAGDHDQDAWHRIGAAQFVSLGTYRKSGELVASPVWLAADGPDLVLTSELATGKIKRLRRDDRVVLRPSSRFGTVEPGSPTATGRCAITGSHGDDPAAVRALRRKYGLQFRVILTVERVIRRLQRKPGERVILRISGPADTTG